MKRMRWINLFGVFLSCVLLLALTVSLTQAQAAQSLDASTVTLGTGFTYQGQLKKGAASVSDSCSIAFRLYDQAVGGQLIGQAITPTVAITNSLFSVQLDFGNSVFNGDARWLGIQVKCTGDAAYIDLGRQPLTAAPYAQFAKTIYRRTIVVSPIGTAVENGTALSNTLARITTASATNPYLLHIEPGVYDLITGTLQMKSYVDIEGSGEDVTTITAAGTTLLQGNDPLWPKSTLSGADNAELRFLTVRNTGGNENAVAIYNRETSPRLTHVTVIAMNGISQTLGVFNNGGTSQMSDMTIAVTGTATVQGVFIFRGASSALTNVAITASGGSGEGININFSSPAIRNSTITSSGVGVEVNDANATPPWDVVTIETSQIHSDGATFHNSWGWPGMTTVRIGASQLAGGDIITATSNITFICAGVYDENFVFSSNTCP
jgi:hypothetical protein